MKRVFTFFTFLIMVATLNGQAPASFKYQAVLRDSRGNVKANTTTNISMDILQGSAAGTSVYSETHRVTTDGSGLINIDLGTGTVISGAMASINWGTGTYFLKISVDGVVMGTSQLLSVPYALYSTKAANGFSDNGAVKKLTVAGETSSMDSALFEVKNKNGQTVFAVYNEGVRIYVDDGTAKGAKGGFAIGGFGTKGASQNYLVVNPDSIRMFIDGNPGKGAKGGFAIGSFSGTKSTSQNLLVVNPDSIRAYIDTNSGKGAKGGFAIGGFGQTKGAEEEYLRITRDSTRVYINNTPSKAAKGGFAIGGFSNSKGERNDYLLISPDSTNFYVRSQGTEASSTFNILSVSENQIQKSLMQANSDTINMASVLNLQNNFNVYGNIGYTGTVSQIVIPSLTTATASNITQTSATIGGNISENGGAVIILSGIVWSTSPNPTVALTTKTTDGSLTGPFTSTMTGLTANTTYYVRAYATNSAGTAYGAEESFTTSGTSTLAVVSTSPATLITTTTASSGGDITNDGGAPILARGVCWSTTSGPLLANPHTSDGTLTGVFVSSLSGLTAGTTYYLRAYASNSVGVAYGNEVSFTTLSAGPTAVTNASSNIATTTATLNGSVNANNQSTTVTFDYGPTISYGSSASANESPVTGSTATNVTANVTGLTAGTLYHFRVKAVNTGGTTYGNDLTFTTSSAVATVSDFEGNIYNTVTIGTQTWMAENLKSIYYNDGSPIPQVTDGAAWSSLVTPAYTWYNNDAATNKAVYGALYNWYVVDPASNGSKNVCPTGWHVPTDAEWTTLTTYLGGESVAGGKLKETGTTHWTPPNTVGTNETGFTALPGGDRDISGVFGSIGIGANWWSSNELDPLNSWNRGLSLDFNYVNRSANGKKIGYSVRCLQGAAAAVVPGLITMPASLILETTATSGGDVMSDGGAAITEKGVVWSTSPSPTILDSKTSDGTGTGPFSSSLTGLLASTTYFVRAYATNSAGTGYGNEISFTTNSTNPVLATLTTNAVVGISFVFAASGGNITSDGGATITQRGVVWSINPNPTITDSSMTYDGTGTGVYPSQMTDLMAGTHYYVRAYATNSVGTAYGDELTFDTLPIAK